MGTAVRVRRGNTEHGTDTANSGYEDGYTSAAVSEDTSPALADNTLLMPPSPPPATNEADGDTTDQGDVNDNAAAETADSDDSADNNINNDETVTIQKVTLADII